MLLNGFKAWRNEEAIRFCLIKLFKGSVIIVCVFVYFIQHERQMEKEETVQMTEELDEQWKSLHLLMSKNKKKVSYSLFIYSGYFFSISCYNSMLSVYP